MTYREGWFLPPLSPPQCYYSYRGPYLTRRPPPCNQPPVVAAVAATAAAAVSGATIFGLSVASISGAAAFLGVNLALGLLSSALTPKPSSPDLSSFASIKSQGLTRQIRQAVTERRIVYGESRVSGPIVFVGSTDTNKYLHMVIALASHEIEEIGEIFINDVSVTPDMLDGNWVVTTGRYENKVRIKKHLGASAQTADSDLVSEVGEWTTSHTLSGIAYIYVRLEFDRNVFPSGIPNFSAWVKGRKITDPRDATERWTPNIGLFAYDYLSANPYGVGVASSSIDSTYANSAINTCDEMVDVTTITATISGGDTTNDLIELSGDALEFQIGDKIRFSGASLPAGVSSNTDYYAIPYQRKTTPRIRVATSLANAIAGTYVTITSDGSGSVFKIAEPRYFGGGVAKVNAERGNNLEEILSSMAGYAVYSGGKWRIYSGEYQSPTLSFGVDDIVQGGINVQTKISKRDRFNRVQGVYVSPLNEGNPSDYPPIENSTYQTEDGGVIKKDINLAYTTRPHTAQRIAKIYLERSRQEIVFSAKFKLTAFKLNVGDNFYFTLDRYGWSNKIFEVIDWSLGIEQDNDGVNVPYISVTARENASAVYDWNNGEETAVDPAPNTNLPDPFTVSVVVGFSLDSVLIGTQGGDKIFNVVASWDAATDQFISSGGKYEVEFKETTESVYKSAGVVDGSATQIEIAGLKPDVLYDIRIFAYNNINVRSAATTINGYQVGTTLITDTEDWENETIAARDGDDWETDTLTSEDWET